MMIYVLRVSTFRLRDKSQLKWMVHEELYNTYMHTHTQQSDIVYSLQGTKSVNLSATRNCLPTQGVC